MSPTPSASGTRGGTVSSTRSGRAVLAASLLVVAVVAFAVGMVVRPWIVGVEGSSNNSLSAVEEGFLQDMSAHHQQALAMAQLVDRPGVDPRVLTLARQIRVEQANEVGTMTGWLQMADRPIGNPTPMSWMTRYGSEGHGHGGGGGAPMPGMATEDELAALGSMPPEQAGTRFLQLMQRHHYGGIAMAEDLVAQVPEGLTSRLARSMVSTQSKETGLMGAMLMERGATS
ncbi:MAG TPA: DUF305 domain-containing protein [Gordonia sp. (in: high G+C Gram-positive bacteria)]|uniref:DUF305 domain-containing protein n=1 Tax=unclassified Gordonia (in: high G+C Gram-positive bacteria) TaxID=2657482 RepID=UPI000FB64E6F|nr:MULTISPECIES: DUF305 domain-containing protein [unclassified Gordonia (in: high G+C Gram-positive bacteria)]RUP41191.1 MAG: DUF305 domain-containing protein [Gordonia sp. (in: high G+C Gram-positive bacteria)]HNP55618.1 DUF305 domain-containing protein [Gordonia sp. (in: high G+C Gram-positive bacteria)]HRC50519.1 DUF305 domain-containing protein [Gordonia sp. (in: high G+C Gram-positive bacteria)]